MERVKDKAIILRRKPFGEADLMLTLYCQKSGKVRALAKGARKISSKLLGFTELFTVIDCQVNFKSSLPIVSQISHDQLFDGVADDIALYERLHTLAELVDKGSEEQEANAALFASLHEGIETLMASSHPLLLASIVTHITAILGLGAQVDRCAKCGEVLLESDALAWDEGHGGLIHRQPTVSGVPLSGEEIKLMRYLAHASYVNVAKLKIAPPLAQKIENLLLQHAQYALEKDLVAPRIGREIRYGYMD